MRPSRRKSVRKGHSAKQFRRQTRRTNSRNMAMPMRGGFRI